MNSKLLLCYALLAFIILQSLLVFYILRNEEVRTKRDFANLLSSSIALFSEKKYCHNQGAYEMKFRGNVRILFLTTWRAYNVFMNREFFQQYEAAKRHCTVLAAELWGPGFPDYDSYATIKQNVQKKFGHEHYFDIVVLHKRDVWKHWEMKFDNSMSGYAVIVNRFEEARDYASAIIKDNAIDISFFSYPMEMLKFTELSYKRLFVHSPFCADETIFFSEDYEGAKRPVNALLIGALHNTVYPLRTRWNKLLQARVIPGGQLLPHPGYFDLYSQETIEEKKIDVQYVSQQVARYAEKLKSTKIVLMDSSAMKYGLMKFIEAAMAGCLIISDIPLERASEFRQFVIEVSLEDSDQQLAETVKYWIEHDKEREEKIRIGQAIVMQKYKWTNFIDLLLESFENYKYRKETGLSFGYPFRVGCRAADTKGKKNEWCW